MKVVLLHAFPLDERMWEPQLEALTDYETFAPRLYGLGSSIDEWALAVLEAIKGNLVVVGASMGGYCALAMARLEPSRVRGLVLAGSRAGADSRERRTFRDELIEELREHGPPADAAPSVTVDELIRATEVLRDRPGAASVVAVFRNPILLAVGDRDELLSVDEATRIVQLAPDGRLEVFKGAGHLLTVEQPDRFNEVLLDYLADWNLGLG
jgi:pimeloyl-ACP methyl ester carboxylesterase